MLETELEFNEEAMSLVDRIEAALQAGALVKAGKGAGKVVADDAKPRITAPGYRGDKADLKPLSKSIRVVVRDYTHIVIVVIGSTWPEGAHGHLVENGHIQRLKDGSTIHVPPHPWLRPAAEYTKPQQNDVVLSTLKEASPKR